LQVLCDMNKSNEDSATLRYERKVLFDLIKENAFILETISKKCKCNVEDIYVGNIDTDEAYDIFYANGGKFPYAVVVGDLNLRYFSSKEDLSELRYVFGGVDFSNSKFNDVSNLEIILGDAFFCKSSIKKLSGLKAIYGNADFYEAEIANVSNLELIKGNARFTKVKIKSLPSLKYIKGKAEFSGIIRDLTSLEETGGFTSFRESEVRVLPRYRKTSGDLVLQHSKVSKMPFLQECGMIYFNGLVKELPSLEKFDGYIPSNDVIGKYINENFLKGSGRDNPYMRKNRTLKK